MAFRLLFLIAALLSYSAYSYNLIQEKAPLEKIVEGKSSNSYSGADNGKKCPNDDPTSPTSCESENIVNVTSLAKHYEEHPIDQHLIPLKLPPIYIG